MPLTKANIVEAVETFLELIKRSLESGEDMMLEPRRVVTFRCSNKLKSKLNGKRR
jgi:nucleoid DNA-binding protein